MLKVENDAAKHSASHSDFDDVGFAGVLSDDDNVLKRGIRTIQWKYRKLWKAMPFCVLAVRS